MSYQNFPNQPPSAGSAGGAGALYLGVNGAPNPEGYPNPGGYPGGYPNTGPSGYPNPGNAAYGQGYYYRPDHDPNASDKNRFVALLLARFFGVIDVHHFYVGKIGSEVAMIFTLGGPGVWTLVDIIVIAAGLFTDVDRRPVIVWDTAN